MSFATPLGLLALLAVPAILALHLFRRRLQERRVAGLFLWTASAPRADAGRRRTRVQNRASLWLELAAAVILALWLSGIRLGVQGSVPHLVIVLDDTASMAGLGGGGVSAADAARRAAVDLGDDLPGDGVVTVVRSGSRPEVLCGPRAPASELAPALAGWRPTATAHDLAPALDLAVELGGRDAQLVLLTDRVPTRASPRFRVEAFGAPAPNAAIVAARRVAAPGGGETVFCDLAVWGRPLRGRVVVEGNDGTPRGEVEAEIEPGRVRHLAVDIPAEVGLVTVRAVVEDDALGLDDACVLPPAPDRTVSMGSALAADRNARLALPRVVAALDGVALAEDPESAHVRFAAAASAVAPGHHEVVVAPVGEAGEQDAWIGPFLLDRRSPLAEGLTLDGVVWSAGRGSLPGDPLVLADAQPLASVEPLGGDALRLWLNLDLGRTNLTSSPDWPILLANLAEYARARLPGVIDVVVPVGDVIRFRGDTAGLVLVDADGGVRPARGRGLATWEARVPGPCRIERDGQVLARVGVHFVDPSESDLTVRAAFLRPTESDPAQPPDLAAAGKPGRLEARALALVLIGLMLADWWVLRAKGGGR